MLVSGRVSEVTLQFINLFSLDTLRFDSWFYPKDGKVDPGGGGGAVINWTDVGFWCFFCGLLCRWSRLCSKKFGCFQSRQMFSGVFFRIMIILILVLFHMIFLHICYCIIWYEIIMQLIRILLIYIYILCIYIYIYHIFFSSRIPPGSRCTPRKHGGSEGDTHTPSQFLGDFNLGSMLISRELCLFLYQPTLFEPKNFLLSRGGYVSYLEGTLSLHL